MDAFSQSVVPGQAAFNAASAQVIPHFYRDSKYMEAESKEKGVPVFKPIDRVKIMQAGEQDNTIEDVHDLHRARWPQQWDAYQRGQEQMVSGTPLIELFPGFPEVIMQLKMVNVHTIEGLIACPDSTATNSTVPFLSEWKKRANEWQARVQKSAGAHELEKALEGERAARKALEDRLAALEAGPSKSKKLNLAPAEEA